MYILSVEELLHETVASFSLDYLLQTLIASWNYYIHKSYHIST